MAIDVYQVTKEVTDGLFLQKKEKHKKLEKQLEAQQSVLNKQKSGLETFRTALKDLGKADEGLLKNNISSSIKDVATVSANEKALKGSYSFFVERLASAHQLAYTDLTDDLVKREQGSLELTIHGKPLNVELKGINSVADLAHAINNTKDNPGITATMVRSNGQQILLLTSDKSGKDNKIEFGGQRPAIFASNKEKELAPAQDSLVYIGDKSKDIKVEMSSNTLDKVIDGVTIELIKVQKPGDPLLEVKVKADPVETEVQIKKFIDAFNNVKSEVSSKDRSDSLSTSIKQGLNHLASKNYGGKTLGMIGISFDRNGNLKLNSKKLSEVLKTTPTLITELLSGKDGLISKLDKVLDPYLSTSDGALKRRSEMLEIRKTSLARTKSDLEQKYQTTFRANLKKYNMLNELRDKLENTTEMISQQVGF
ncbi:flagellar filament capping protein FliD [Yersinia enterocolitica]|uniref:flagellar filament capping protein FliD n=1 Tax=Yersinia enterocolitica TaxID=630 RepID=UPI00097760FE|nr:flagellar filament capping protein FliD [Yersinia enterocolitica]EKN3458521.1 flagellar filament capping protein FliD [Yersinia enterocolitica]EKN3570117.1 flagellar filament capping protein FliD [Yersinia enterocolitica]EKN4742671.1 flagellar filament capping protein FliD [Yersinia enterocolitica]EKN4768402.1 flagellar filament capping protein FliD [Yersinia enterocolitica]EKN4838526.1 flagellar filament capping protein FliD [Yersinia enterocolitica]